MSRLILGTGIIAGFPTLNGNIYPREVLEKAINDQYFRRKIECGEMVGGILDNRTQECIGNMITHKVLDVRLYNEEVVVEIETIDSIEAQLMFSSIKTPEAAMLVNCPEAIATGMTIRQINGIKAIHVPEKR